MAKPRTWQSYEERVAAGLKRLEVWIPAEYFEEFDAMCAAMGRSRPEQLVALVLEETMRRKRRDRRRRPAEPQGMDCEIAARKSGPPRD